LTPQLRTRLGRLERVVGWFVALAVVLLLAGLGFYLHKLAQRKGWGVTKAPFFTYLRSGAGIKPGDAVKLMGFDVGEITKVTAEEPGKEYDVYVEFVVRAPFYGYVWDDSAARVKGGLLGARYIELTKGGTLRTNNLHAAYKESGGRLTHVFNDKQGEYAPWRTGDQPYWLVADEPPELSSHLDDMVKLVKVSLTNILALTNALTRTLTNAADATGHLSELLVGAKPVLTNLAIITGNITNQRGSLGEWLIPTNMNFQLTALLTNANSTVGNVNATVTNANTNLVVLFSNLTVNLENLADITSNLNAQVQGNTNLVKSVSDLIIHADDMVQGLKRHWLLRSAFKTNAPPPPAVPPKGPGRGRP
jgi:ABC-type transporter Mla subunit MlaD